MESKLLYEDLTREIIGAAMEVHRVLGHGLLESVYEEALCYELRVRNIPFEQQKELPIPYKDITLNKKFRADLVVDSKVIVDNKATSGLTKDDEKQLFNYLNITKLRVGLLLNFGKPSLEWMRRIV
jgi:GxxExxY protein